MLKEIELLNFQSHSNSRLELSEGVNVIIGSSDEGKTAIIRALNWLINNRPTGLSLLSYWDRDDKGQPKAGQLCSVILEDGTEVIRIRTKDFNGYEIDPDGEYEEFEAIKTDVPKEISDLLNMSEINLQKQFDSPFLLSESAAEIARSFNRVIKLDSIDSILSNAESKRRKIVQDINRNEEELENVSGEIEKYDWIEKAKAKNKILLRRNDRVRLKMNEMSNLSSFVTEIKSIEFLIENIPKNLDMATSLISQAEKLYGKVESGKTKKLKLETLVTNYLKAQKEIENIPEINYSEMNIKMKEASHLFRTINENMTDYNYINRTIREIIDLENEEMFASKDIKRYEDMLPDTCPLCGQQWSK